MNLRKLSDIVDLLKGKKPEISTNSDGNLPYLTAKYIRGESDPKYGIPNSKGSVLVCPDDYVIIMDGSNSGEVFTDLNGILASTMGKIVLKEKINQKYLGYFLESNKKLFSRTKTGSAIPHLSKEVFFNLEIPVPSLVKQEKIVQKLDKSFSNIDKLIKNSEKNIEDIKSLFNSFLSDIFSSNQSEDLIQLDSLSTYISRGLQPKYSDKSETLVINQRCIRDNKVNFGVGRYHDQNLKKVAEDKKIQIGDILINSTGVGTLGRVAQVTELPNNDVTVDTHVTIFRPDFNILSKEFSNWLFVYLQNLIEKMGVGASGQTELRREDLKNMKIINPPNIKVQQGISEKLDNLKIPYDNYLRLKKDLVIKYSMLKNSILEYEFSHE